MLVVGIDPGFASSPTGVAVLDFGADGNPRLVERGELKARCGGGWDERSLDIAAQLHNWLWSYNLAGGTLALAAIEWVYVSERERPDAGGVNLSRAEAKAAKNRGGGNVQTALKLAFHVGALSQALRALHVPTALVMPVQSKQALTGNHMAGKDEMTAMARRLYGDGITEHIADAIGHAYAAEALSRRERLVKKAGGGK